MINVSFYIEMRDCHRGAQEGQALFYWFQAVFFFTHKKTNKEQKQGG